jgi:hypothetical protein
MARFLEFISHNWQLSSVFFGLLVALFWVESQRQGRSISSSQATQLINKQQALVLDLRDTAEFDAGHIAGARHIPLSALNEQVRTLKDYQDKPIILVCKLGQHSGAAGKLLKQQGFSQVVRLSGGVSGWLGDNLPLVKA